MITRPRWHLLNEGRGKGINIFFAGAGFTYELAYDAGVRKRLLSWHANSPDELGGYIQSQGPTPSFGIVDSGAFTVWNKGGTIHWKEYAAALRSLLLHFDVAANLDVIPGRKGMAASDMTPELIESAAKAGWDNFINIRNELGPELQGRVMPIYHQHEHIDWLKRMLDVTDYVGISPSNDYHSSQRMHWLDDVFDYLRSLPKTPKTHGYAVTAPILMETYPWFSVDSASWVMKGGVGMVSTPYGDVTLTDRKEMMGKVTSWDGANWSPEMKLQVIEYFRSIGLTIDELRADYKKRWIANAKYLLAYEKSYQHKPKQRAQGLFDIFTPQEKSGDNELNDCYGMKLPDQLGDIPMAMLDASQEQD